MNLFRSEEHAHNWLEFKPYYLEMLKPLSYWLERFSSEMMKNRRPAGLHFVVHSMAFSAGPAKISSQWPTFKKTSLSEPHAYHHSGSIQKLKRENHESADECCARSY